MNHELNDDNNANSENNNSISGGDKEKSIGTNDNSNKSNIMSDHFGDNNENKNTNNFMDIMSKSNDSSQDASQIQCIKFGVFQQHQWHTLLDHNHQEL